MTLPERMVEAAARASHNANPGDFRPWDVLAQASAEGSTFAVVVMEGQRAAARAALTAALAVAVAEGVWLCRVPEPIKIGNHLHGHETLRAEGYNDAIDDTLAGRVTL